MIANRSRMFFIAATFLAAFAACRKNVTSTQETKAPAAEEHAAASEPALPETVKLTTAAIAEAGIQTWKVQAVDLEHVVVLSGTVGHDENALLQVASNVKGRVASIPVDLGAHLRKGDPIVWIESIELSHAWDEFVKARAELSVASRAYERAKTLLESKAISAGEMQSREATYLSRQAEADTMERALRLQGESEEEIEQVRKTVESGRRWIPASGPHRVAVRAPFAGRVIDRKVTPGSLVEALQPLVTLANNSTVWVSLQAYEKDLSLIHEGLPVSIRTEAFPEESFPGRIDFIGGVVDESTRTLRIRATVRNRSERLRPGMFAKATVEVPKPNGEPKGLLAVPQSALQSLEGRQQIFVETEPGLFVRRAVETGHTFEGFTEILSGVKLGEKVVTEGSFVLKSEFAKATLAEEE